MIEGKKFIEIVKQYYSFLETEFNFKKVNEIINGNAFYDVEFKDKEKVVSISYENIENHLEIIIFILQEGQMPDYDDKTKTLHLSQMSAQVLSKIDRNEIHINNEFFVNINVEDELEKKLLKRAKELRLCLKHFKNILEA